MGNLNELELLKLLDKFRDKPIMLNNEEYKSVYCYIEKLENIVITLYKDNRNLKNKNNELNNLLLEIKERVI